MSVLSISLIRKYCYRQIEHNRELLDELLERSIAKNLYELWLQVNGTDFQILYCLQFPKNFKLKVSYKFFFRGLRSLDISVLYM